jgi:non-heme chloroperoxidase
MGESMPYIETTDGTRIFYTDWGIGKPLILIHGWAMSSGMWEYQISALTSQGLRCISYDQRGCGRSDQPGYGYDFDTYADDLAAVLRQLRLNAVTLLGYSLGGGVVARYLSRHGSSVTAKAILVASNTPYLLKTADNPDGLDRSILYNNFAAGLHRDRPHLFAGTGPAFFNAGEPGIAVSGELMHWAADLCHSASPEGMLDLYRAVNETDFRSDMSAFTMPTLVIHGDADPFTPIELSGLRTARAIPGSRLEIYEGASHGLFYTHRDRLNNDILNFVQN